jgi:Double zinc ribbon
MNESFNERLRLIRFRRKREHTTFRDEFRIIPRWLVRLCITLAFLALIIGVAVNIHNIHNGGPIFPDDSYRTQPELATLGLAGVILLCSIFFSAWLFILGYVYRDAKRRDMNPVLWTLLVLILSASVAFIGFVIYLLVREPLPYTCPNCAASVNARFNFCPNCKTNLRPACPACQREVSDTDKFCPYCATDLTHPPAAPIVPTTPTPPL